MPSKIKKVNKNNDNTVSRRDRILGAAMEIFAEKGYQDAHVREIARRATVSEVTIYGEFKDKEDLLHAIPEMTMLQAMEQLALHMEGIKGAINRLRKFTWLYLYLFESKPDWSKVVLLQIKPSSRFLQTQAYQQVRAFTRFLIQILEEGQQEGLIRTDLDLNLARHVFIGGVEHITERWLLLGKPERITSYAEDLFGLFLRAFGTSKALEMLNHKEDNPAEASSS
jgi:TetR/AcrR family transcriptional regulator, fatty acid metabolism regulator protein